MNRLAWEKEDAIEWEDWNSQGYGDSLRDRWFGSKLTNDIHSMFSFELDEPAPYRDAKARWGALTMEEYELFDQPLRLATKWLESTPSSDAICSILEGNRSISQDYPVHNGLAMYEFQHHSLSPSVAHEMARNVLKRLGASITFHATDRDRGTDLKDRTYGRTSPLTTEHTEGVAVTHRPEFKGLASKTCISLEYLKTLQRLLLDPGMNKFQIQKLYFEMALTMCHEVIHAMTFAIDPELLKHYIEEWNDFEERNQRFKADHNDPFYEDERVAELGYFWENKVFGGICLQSVSDTDNPTFVTDWPSWLLRSPDYPERAPPRMLTYKYLLSTHYIRNSQTQEFWDTVQRSHSQDLLALQIWKRVGVPCYDKSGGHDRTWDATAPGNLPKFAGKSRRVLNENPNLSPCARILNETFGERIDRLEAEGLMASPRVSEPDPRGT